MNYIITSIGVLIMVIGVLFAAIPSLARKFIEFAKVGKHIYIGGVVRIVLGTLLVWTSPVASFMWIPFILGALMILSGIAIFVFRKSRIHAYLDWWYAKPDKILRIPFIVAAVLGALLIYSA